MFEMKLYQSPRTRAVRRKFYRPLYRLGCTLLIAWALTACASPQVEQSDIQVTLIYDGRNEALSVPPGTTGRGAFELAGVQIDLLDEAEPPLYTVLAEGETVRLIRVREEFDLQELVIPYETQTLRNESLPEGERLLIQPGVNGLQEVTYRRVIEDGVEVSRSPVKTVIIEEPVPEIVMVGSQTPFAAVTIPGQLAYLSAGNAWIMEITTSNRRAIVTTGDLDGRVFSLSPDGEWLLYTRAEESEETINSLWVTKTDESNQTIDLRVSNVVHFADWVDETTLGAIFSTVEPSSTAPGWQANNDLQVVYFSENGWVQSPRTLLDGSSGGLYGWWGTNFAWSPGRDQLAYARPDGVGLIDLETEQVIPLLEITPWVTGSDWAWVPGLSWAPRGNYLYTVDHVPEQTGASLEGSPQFDLTAIPLAAGVPIAMVPEVGMFAYPIISPSFVLDSEEQSYFVAYLHALVPTQSETGYQVVVMDRDGSNPRRLFPPEGAPGLDPQRVVWSPTVEEQSAQMWLAVIYQKNLWLLNVATGQVQQLTGDGQTTVLDWK